MFGAQEELCFFWRRAELRGPAARLGGSQQHQHCSGVYHVFIQLHFDNFFSTGFWVEQNIPILFNCLVCLCWCCFKTRSLILGNIRLLIIWSVSSSVLFTTPWTGSISVICECMKQPYKQGCMLDRNSELVDTSWCQRSKTVSIRGYNKLAETWDCIPGCMWNSQQYFPCRMALQERLPWSRRQTRSNRSRTEKVFELSPKCQERVTNWEPKDSVQCLAQCFVCRCVFLWTDSKLCKKSHAWEMIILTFELFS